MPLKANKSTVGFDLIGAAEQAAFLPSRNDDGLTACNDAVDAAVFRDPAEARRASDQWPVCFPTSGRPAIIRRDIPGPERGPQGRALADKRRVSNPGDVIHPNGQQ